MHHVAHRASCSSVPPITGPTNRRWSSLHALTRSRGSSASRAEHSSEDDGPGGDASTPLTAGGGEATVVAPVGAVAVGALTEELGGGLPHPTLVVTTATHAVALAARRTAEVGAKVIVFRLQLFT
jgi:hypothetical protein